MNFKASLANSMSLNEINPECDSVIGEFISIKEEDTSEYSHGQNFQPPLGGLPVESIEKETSTIDGIRTCGEQSRQGIAIKTEIKLENVDVEGNSSGLNDKKLENICKVEKMPNILIKPDSDVCCVNNSDVHDIQISTNTNIESYKEYKSSYCVKGEITIDENYLEKKETVNGVDESMHDPLQTNECHRRVRTNESKFHCVICSKNFKYKRTLYTHKLVHTNQRPFECALCNKSFKHQKYLRRHKLVHTSERLFECTRCTKRFKCNQDLVRHKILHRNERLFACAICSKFFKIKSVLRRHESVHATERPFKCEHCNKYFKDKVGLSQHEQTHSNLLKFECSLCDKSFRFKRSLVSHQACHTSSRPFVCACCNKSFKRKNDLTRHELVHSQQPSVGVRIL